MTLYAPTLQFPNSGSTISWNESFTLWAKNLGEFGGTTTPIITNYNGCTASSTTSATVTAALTAGSGNTQIYYNTTDYGAGVDKSLWQYSTNVLLKYNGNNWTESITGLSPGTTYYYKAYVSSVSTWGTYSGEDWAPASTEFKTVSTTPSIAYNYQYDLAIFYNSLEGTDFIDCRCSRWDVDNYSIVIETWMKKNDVQNLKDYTLPGAVGELYNIMGKPRFYDKSWEGKNTLRLLPTPSSVHMTNSTLRKMRRETLIYPKNITTSPIRGDNGFINVKIEGYISGSNSL